MREKYPLVSVVVPTYNRAKFLSRSILSILNQTYKFFELIIIDDGSIDNTEKIVREYQKMDNRIKYISFPENRGASVARNYGIRIAKGKYIAFQDSDDEWFLNKLEKQIKVFNSLSSKVGVVYSDMLKIRGNKKLYSISPHITPEDKIVYKKALNYGLKRIGLITTLIKKECFSKIGLFDENLFRYIDLDLFIRLSKFYYFYHIKEPLAVYYITQESISSNEKELLNARKRILNKYYDDIKQDKTILSNHYLGIGLSLLSSENIIEGRKYILNALKLNPMDIRTIFGLLTSYLNKELRYHIINMYKKMLFLIYNKKYERSISV